MTIIIDGTVGANKAVVLDSSGKLPVIDGSLVTTLNATQVTTGTVATARIDTGTTTGKILVLDGSGNMPAIAAGGMTGVSAATKSASDPTVSTNPATGLGTKWINTTSGEIFILTDATAGENVWTSTGGTSGNVKPWAFSAGGEISVYTMGGWLAGGGLTNKIEKISVTADANATDISNLTATSHGWGGASSSTHGYTNAGGVGMGSTTAHNRIEKFQFSSDGDAADIADMTVSKYNRSGHSMATHGYSTGGQNGPAPTSVNVIDRYPFASDTDATDVGDLLQIRCLSASASDTDYGYCSGGESGPGDTNTIQRFQFVASANSTDVGNLVNSVAHPAGHTYITHGYVCGNGNVIQRFSYASSGDATDLADLTWSIAHGQGSESTTYGYQTGGYPASNVMQKFAFVSTANATDVGDLSENKAAVGTSHN